MAEASREVDRPSSDKPSSHKIVWFLIALVGAGALGVVALNRGEPVNAVWLVIAAICVYLIAYRFYSLFIATRVLQVDPSRPTPAARNNDGLDYVPTNKYVLFGHHFAAIAGAGPLVGPVLAAQMGYLPGTLWILAGVVFAGAVQDFIILFISTRRDGRSLGDMIKTEMGTVPGVIAMVGVLAIMIILLAVLALIVVKALADSPWGTFTVLATLPIAMLMGVYGRFLRPHRIGEMSAIGFVLLMAAIFLGQPISQSAMLAPMFTFSGETLALMLIAYGFIASVLPPLDLPQDRYDHRTGDRYRDRHARAKDACGQQVHRWHRAGLRGGPLSVPVHHHCLRRGLGLPRPHRFRHDAEDDRE